MEGQSQNALWFGFFGGWFQVFSVTRDLPLALILRKCQDPLSCTWMSRQDSKGRERKEKEAICCLTSAGRSSRAEGESMAVSLSFFFFLRMKLQLGMRGILVAECFHVFQCCFSSAGRSSTAGGNLVASSFSELIFLRMNLGLLIILADHSCCHSCCRKVHDVCMFCGLHI